MRAIEPDMVLGKSAIDGEGSTIGEIVDVGLYTHSRVKFLVVRDKTRDAPLRVGVEAITALDADAVHLQVA